MYNVQCTLYNVQCSLYCVSCFYKDKNSNIKVQLTEAIIIIIKITDTHVFIALAVISNFVFLRAGLLIGLITV